MVRREVDHGMWRRRFKPLPGEESLSIAKRFADGKTDFERARPMRLEEQASAGSMRIRSVLVPLDASAFAEHALPPAAAIARRAGAELRVVHVHVPPRPSDPVVRHYFPDGPYGPSKSSRFEYLEDVARRLARAGAVTATPPIHDSWDVPAALESAAADADLVVMATHARGPLARIWHGHAPIPPARGQRGLSGRPVRAGA